MRAPALDDMRTNDVMSYSDIKLDRVGFKEVVGLYHVFLDGPILETS
jgi:hypothetical protein